MTQTSAGGVFRLRSPIDLLRKMEFHCEQLSADPLNDYAAFDFFVAAEHLPEWLGKVRCAPGPGDETAQALRRICSHLANGAKHFQTDSSHSAVRETGKSTPAISGIARSGITFSGAVHPKLIVLLSPDEAAVLGAPVVSVVGLARRVLTYWRDHESIKRAEVD